MAVTNVDVLRVFDTPANLTANLKAAMFGYDTTNDRFAAKLLATSAMVYVSEDTKQCLLAGVQTITGAKTFSADLTLTEDLIIGDGKYIGSASDPDAIQIEDDGDVVLSQDLTVTGVLSASDDIKLTTNNKNIYGKTSGGVEKQIIGLWSTNSIVIDQNQIGVTCGGSLGVVDNLTVEKCFGTSSVLQTITGDNQLLNSNVASYLYVTTATSGDPTSYTCGMRAGYDGQIITIQMDSIESANSAIEINDSVALSADIYLRGISITTLTLYGSETATFIYKGTENRWVLLHTDGYLKGWTLDLAGLEMRENGNPIYGYTAASDKKEIIGINGSDKVEIDGDALGAVCSGDVVLSQDLSVGGNLTAKGSIICHADGRSDFGAGYSNLANAQAAQDAVGGKTRIIVEPYTTNTDDYYSFSGLVDGQRIIIINTGCVDARIDDGLSATFAVTIFEGREAIYDATLGLFPI